MGILRSIENAKTLLFGVDNYTAGARRVINKFANEKINDIIIYRNELSKGLKFVLSAVSRQDFDKRVKELGYDKLYHLGIVIDTNKGRYSLEKNETITLKERPIIKGEACRRASTSHTPDAPEACGARHREHETLAFKVNKTLTLSQLLNNTHKYMGNKYFVYDAIRNNCQDFILSIFKANHLSSPNVDKFIKQNNLDSLFDKQTKTAVDVVTETGGRLNTLRQPINPIIKLGGTIFNRLTTQNIQKEEPEEEERKEKIEL